MYGDRVITFPFGDAVYRFSSSEGKLFRNLHDARVARAGGTANLGIDLSFTR
jgi:hypothetical protein